ncbi:hypothetical protein [Clostridium magnum]|uniref:Uncharacterized protein n=1 Tax=Clostridium magnum DSM 2767 TaxID=1121326 RepID=A0A161XDS5_9CLOT|nr:hypothetical protein [Clostridium magnum]KZL92496.1 hypothetical protein CLMAG_23050 [Clostridium magnum DSM 2767]SHI26314.1 hypothetical protein SAMN02745944_03737 [Clostridium magnum DSM 2767]
MWIIEFLKKSLEGRGFYPSLLVIISWTYTIVMVGVLICQIFLYIFRVKYCGYNFIKNADGEIGKKEGENE